jgi:hypothetical protein
MKATLAGPGALGALEGGRDGRVIASFTRVCYIEFPAGLVALVAPEVMPGPIHVVLDGAPPADARGTRVSMTPSALEAPGWRMDTRAVARWAGALPEPAALLAGAPIALAAGGPIAARSALRTGQYLMRADSGHAALLAGDLDDTARLLVGLGPGLTPAGDDALCGILLVLRCVLGERFEAEAALVTDRLDTTAPSRAFLHWAGRGQALAPAHDLLNAAAEDDQAAAAAACEALGRVGDTSGRDFVLGLAWGLEAVSAGAAFYPAATSR